MNKTEYFLQNKYFGSDEIFVFGNNNRYIKNVAGILHTCEGKGFASYDDAFHYYDLDCQNTKWQECSIMRVHHRVNDETEVSIGIIDKFNRNENGDPVFNEQDFTLSKWGNEFPSSKNIEYFIISEKWDGSNCLIGKSMTIIDNDINGKENNMVDYQGEGFLSYKAAYKGFELVLETSGKYLKRCDIIKTIHSLNTFEIPLRTEFSEKDNPDYNSQTDDLDMHNIKETSIWSSN